MMTSFGTRRRPWLYIATFIGLTLLLILLDSQHAFDPIKGGASMSSPPGSSGRRRSATGSASRAAASRIPRICRRRSTR